MSFAAAAGIANADLIYSGLPRLPAEGEELYAGEFSLQLGGGVIATMAQLGRLGVPAVVGTFLGEDLFSGFIRGELERLGVSWHNLYKGGGRPVAVTSVAVTPGERTFLSYYEGPQAGGGEQQEITRLCTGARVVAMKPEYLDAYRPLKAAGTTLVLDMGWDDELSFEKYHEALELADYFTPNRKEAMKITGAASPEEAVKLLERYFATPIMKLDGEGCLVRENGESFLVKSIPDFKALDSTGAGDAFLAGFMYGLYYQKTIRQCVLYGNICGGNCVTQIGALAAPLTEREMLAWAEKYAGYVR